MQKHVDLSDFRKEYTTEANKDSANNSSSDTEFKDPIGKFDEWFHFAKQNCKSFEEINAVSLATVNKQGRPRCRIVLLKGFGPDGFQFFTNYNSDKGQELDLTPFAAMAVYWPSINRSVRIEGKVEKLADDVSAEYWAKRPPKSQAGAFVSDQSKPLTSRSELQANFDNVISQFVDKSLPIPKPENWGGYKLIPDRMEFWRGSEGRLHDRLLYTRGLLEPFEENFAKRGINDWYYGRLQP